MKRDRKMLEAVAKLLAICVMMSHSPCSAQAPGDGDDRCLESSTIPTYPDNEKTLMDSYHYLQLLPGNGSGRIVADTVWNDRSIDRNDETNTINPTYWQQGAGGICRFQVRVCGWRYNRGGGIQDNWLFTQYINKDFDSNSHNYPVKIRVDVTYALQSCWSRNRCVMGFRLHNYTTNTRQVSSTTESGYLNYSNYQEFGRAVAPNQNPRRETYTFTLDPSDTGFYVALRDTGTCVGVSRLRVYHYKCPSRQEGLVLYPETPAAVDDRLTNTTCADNATHYGSEQITCHRNGTWGLENPVCKCDCGFEETLQCTKCPPGTYSPGNGIACQQCPPMTEPPDDPKCICDCLPGYFRYKAGVERPNVGITWPPSDEGPHVGCSKPPSAPRNLRLRDIRSTSITVSWSKPSDDGGRQDLYYQIEYFPTNAQENRVVKHMRSTTDTISGLKPYTQYTIKVSAHNGVSDQDPERSQSRTIEETNTTDEDVSGRVRDLQCFCRVLLWQEPAEPNGRIRDYELNYTRGGKKVTFYTAGTQTFFLTNLSSIPGDSGPFTVEVRARNGAGRGLSLCPLKCDPVECSTEPTTCRLCPRQQVGLVKYPDTAAPEGSPISVTTQCVDNAESDTSLVVTCDSNGKWGDETPQCNCKEGFKLSQDKQQCLGDTPPTDPPTDPPTCLSCPEDIRTGIYANCTDVLIFWKPVSGAQGYKLQFLEKDKIFLNKTADENLVQITLSDSLFKDKEMFSIKIRANLSVDDGSSSILVNAMELTKKCGGDSEKGALNRDDSEDVDALSLSIAIVATFVVTAAVVAFLAITICLVVNAKKKRSGGKGDTNGTHSSSQYPMKDYMDTEDMKCNM